MVQPKGGGSKWKGEKEEGKRKEMKGRKKNSVFPQISHFSEKHTFSAIGVKEVRVMIF